MPESSEAAMAGLGAGVRRRRSVRRPGVLVPVAVLVVAVLVFLWVLLVGTEVVLAGPGFTSEDWALTGSLVLAALLVVLLAYATASRNRALDQAALARAPPAPRGQVPPKRADELRVTADEWRGLRVLEYSKPPKSEERTGLYTRCHVRVDGTYVLRVEDLVARRRE